MTTCHINQNAVGRFYVQSAEQPDQAWSGSRWAEHVQGVGISVQIANFSTRHEAHQYATRSGFKVLP
jgi:hypothetical protein